jgi:hypothetical protein
VALLQGLIDTDGYIDAHRIEINTVSKTMAYQIKELVMSLGGTCNIGRKVGSYSKNGVKILCEEVYRLNFSFPNTITFKVARLNRKLGKLKLRDKYAVNKFISSIEYSHDEEAKCIMVENPEHLYVTDDYIVTHNTTMITKLANSAMNDGLKVLQIFFEDTTKVIKRKHLSCWTKIPLNELSDPQWRDRLNKEIEVRTSGKGRLLLKKFPSDGTTIPKIRQYIKKKISQGFRPDIVLLDYIDCVVPTKEFKDEYAGEGNVMRQFESMLSEFDIAGWTAVQGNRCLRLNTEVQTVRLGKCEIKDVIEGDEILTHNGHKKVVKVFPITKQAVYKIKTKSGKEIFASARHEFPVKYGKLMSISTGLSVGDKLLTKK